MRSGLPKASEREIRPGERMPTAGGVAARDEREKGRRAVEEAFSLGGVGPEASERQACLLTPLPTAVGTAAGAFRSRSDGFGRGGRAARCRSDRG